MLKSFLTLFLGMVLFTSTAAAQITVGAVGRTNWADSSAQKIVASYRTRGALSKLGDLLRQEPMPEATRLKVIDSLAKIGTSTSPAAESPGYNAEGQAAIWSLVNAGSKDPLNTPDVQRSGKLVPGILDRLIEIDRALDSTDRRRLTVLGKMLNMPEHSRAMQYLLGVATSKTDLKYGRLAMISLITDAQPNSLYSSPSEKAETMRALHELWNRYQAEPIPAGAGLRNSLWPPTVLYNDDATKILIRFAREQGWSDDRKRGN